MEKIGDMECYELEIKQPEPTDEPKDYVYTNQPPFSIEPFKQILKIVEENNLCLAVSVNGEIIRLKPMLEEFINRYEEH